MIVPMKKITILGMLSQKDSIIKSLMELGAVQIDNANKEFSDFSVSMKTHSVSKEIAEIEKDITTLSDAISHLDVIAKSKKGLFATKKEISEKGYQKIVKNKAFLLESAGKVVSLVKQIDKLKADINHNEDEIALLTPYINYDIPLNITHTKSTCILTGFIPKKTDFPLFKEKMQELSTVCDAFYDSQADLYIYLITSKDNLTQLSDTLQNFSFTKADFSAYNSTAHKVILNLKDQISHLNKQIESAKKDISNFVDLSEELKCLYDILSSDLRQKQIYDNLSNTKSSFVICGWITEKDSEKVKKYIESSFQAAVILDNPKNDEEYPVLLDNPKVITPFEVITELYSMPKATSGIDPNIFMAPFYFVFFGLMLSDAMYGLLLGIAGAFILYRYKPQGTAKKLIALLTICAISTFFWGAMFGGWFGNLASAVTNGRFSIKPLWFDPLDDPMKLLIWSFGFGLIHIYTALIICAYSHVKRGDIKSAVFDVGFWLMVLIGLPLLASNAFLYMIGINLSQNISDVLSKTGIALTVVGVIGLILTQGRKEKNIFKKFFKGISSLYDITGYVSDVLSYSRLLALGLSTSVISMVVNTMGTLLGLDSVVGIILFTVVFILGHALNLSINVLGAYVHTSRLQYVEFFGKFYEGGGKMFKPFKEKTKYITRKHSHI